MDSALIIVYYQRKVTVQKKLYLRIIIMDTVASRDRLFSEGKSVHYCGVRSRDRIADSMSTYLIIGPEDTDPQGRYVADVVRAALSGGIRFLQLRAKHAEAFDILKYTRKISSLLPQGEPGVDRPYFVLNDRVDVAWAARCDGLPVDGVHIGQKDVPAYAARKLLGENAIVGLTVSNLEEVKKANPAIVDYVSIGSYRANPSKPGRVCVGDGDSFRKIVSESLLPSCVVGGVTASDAADVYDAGADGLCVISAICEAVDPEAATAELAKAWSDASGTGFKPPHVFPKEIPEEIPGNVAASDVPLFVSELRYDSNLLCDETSDPVVELSALRESSRA